VEGELVKESCFWSFLFPTKKVKVYVVFWTEDNYSSVGYVLLQTWMFLVTFKRNEGFLWVCSWKTIELMKLGRKIEEHAQIRRANF
jgi:hypothetical protein